MGSPPTRSCRAPPPPLHRGLFSRLPARVLSDVFLERRLLRGGSRETESRARAGLAESLHQGADAPFFLWGLLRFFSSCELLFPFFPLFSSAIFVLFFRTKNRCLEGERETRPADLEHGQKEMPQLPLAGVVAMLASANSTADEEAARARLQEKLDDAGARVVARSSSRVSHAVVLLPPGASSSASALKQCITQDELRGLHGRLAGVRV